MLKRRPDFDAKNSASVHESNLRDKSFGWSGKELYSFARQRGTQQAPTSPKLYFPAWEDKMMNFIAMFQGQGC